MRNLSASIAFLTLVAGCMSVLHPVHAPPREVCAGPRMLPQCCRDRVHVFFVHGLDPLNYCNLSGLRNYCHSLGFSNTYYGQLYHGGTFTKEIRRIHQQDPEARFVLVGFSAGANVVRGMANTLGQEDGIPIDLMVYMGGNTLKDVPENRPATVTKVVHILATGYVWKGYQIEGAENHKLAGTWHFGSPTHPETLEMFAREMTAIAARLPYQEEAAPKSAYSPPTPRNTARHTSFKRDGEWDFLKPVTQLRSVGDASSNRPVAEPVAKSEGEDQPR